MKAQVIAGVLVVAVMVSLTAASRSTDVTITLTDEEYAAVVWVVSEAPVPSTRSQAWLADRTPSGYLYALVKGQLSRDIERKTQTSNADVIGKMRGLPPAKCAAVAGQLGVPVTSLPCGIGK